MYIFGFLLDGTEQKGNGTMEMVMLFGTIAMLAIFFFFSYRSRKKQEREDAKMRDELQVGDEVITIDGIIGKVVSIKGETFVLETTKEKTKIRFLKAAIRTIDVKASSITSSIPQKAHEQEPEKDGKSSKKK